MSQLDLLTWNVRTPTLTSAVKALSVGLAERESHQASVPFGVLMSIGPVCSHMNRLSLIEPGQSRGRDGSTQMFD